MFFHTCGNFKRCRPPPKKTNGLYSFNYRVNVLKKISLASVSKKNHQKTAGAVQTLRYQSGDPAREFLLGWRQFGALFILNRLVLI